MKLVITLAALFLYAEMASADLEDIASYREYSETLSSAGQPSEEQLQDAWVDGFERVVYLAFTDQQSSVAHEDRFVKELGMEYVHIPVNWGAPTSSDFYLFAGMMQRQPGKKTLVHCQVNFRASAFSFLYRVIYEDVAVSEAKADMNSVWTPNKVWTAMILSVLAENDVSSECEDCDWAPQEH